MRCLTNIFVITAIIALLFLVPGDNYPLLNTPVTAATTFFNDPEIQKTLHFETERSPHERAVSAVDAVQI